MSPVGCGVAGHAPVAFAAVLPLPYGGHPAPSPVFSPRYIGAVTGFGPLGSPGPHGHTSALLPGYCPHARGRGLWVLPPDCCTSGLPAGLGMLVSRSPAECCRRLVGTRIGVLRMRRPRPKGRAPAVPASSRRTRSVSCFVRGLLSVQASPMNSTRIILKTEFFFLKKGCHFIRPHEAVDVRLRAAPGGLDTDCPTVGRSWPFPDLTHSGFLAPPRSSRTLPIAGSWSLSNRWMNVPTSAIASHNAKKAVARSNPRRVIFRSAVS